MTCNVAMYMWKYLIVHTYVEQKYIYQILFSHQLTMRKQLYPCSIILYRYGTTTACPDYRGVRISEASGVFPVGVAMHSRAVECLASPLARAKNGEAPGIHCLCMFNRALILDASLSWLAF